MHKKLYVEVSLWFFLSVFLGIQSIKLGIGTASSPGPGFMPLILASVLLILSLSLLIKLVISQKEMVGQKLDIKIGAFYIALPIVIYIFVFKKIGYLFATLLLMTILFKYMGAKKWSWALAEAFLVTVLSYLFFGFGLGLNLPGWIF